MDVRLPDGTVIQNVPEGTSKADLVRKLASNGYDVSWYKPEAAQESKPISKGADFAETAEELPWYQQLAAGAGGAFTGMGLGLRQLTGVNAPSEQEVQEYQRAMQGLRGTGAGFTGEILGNIAPGAVGMGAVGMIPKVAQVLGAGGAGAAKMLAGIGGGIGAVEGALSPVTEDQSRAANVGLQGAFGAVAPAATGLVTNVGQRIGQMVMPAVSDKSARLAGAQLVRDTAGSKADVLQRALGGDIRQRVARATGAQPVASASVISPQTAGQRLAESGVVAPEAASLMKRASEMFPTAAADTVKAQQAARLAALESFGKTPEALQAAEKAREEVFKKAIAGAEDLFSSRRKVALENFATDKTSVVKEPILDVLGMVRGWKVKPLEVPSVTPALNALKAENKGMQAAMADARKMAASRAALPEALTGMSDEVRKDIIKDPTQSLQGLELIKYAIDQRFKNPSALNTALSKIDDATLTQLKTTYLNAVDAVSPEYAAARKAYADASKDITEMKIGQKAMDILQKPIGPGERGAMLASRVEDETSLLKQVGGFTRKELAEQLKPENLEKLNKVVKELDIDANFASQASAGAKGKKVEEAFMGVQGLPHLLNNAVVIINNALRLTSGVGKERTLKELAAMVQDPQMLAEMMAKASAKEKNAIKFLVNAQKAGAIVGPAVMETSE